MSSLLGLSNYNKFGRGTAVFVRFLFLTSFVFMLVGVVYLPNMKLYQDKHQALGNITALSDPKAHFAVREIRPKEGAATSTVVEGAPYTHTGGPHCHPLTVKVGSGGSQWGPHCQSWQWGSLWGLTVPPRVRACPGGSAGWQ